MAEAQPPENETPNQRQARLRREKRQAKIAAGGGDRLNKIIGVQGRQVSEADDVSSAGTNAKSDPTSASTTSRTANTAPQHASVSDVHDDPAEMDVSEHFYEPRRTQRIPQAGPQASPFGAFGDISQMQGGGNASDDPMMAMLQQLMSDQAGMPGGPGGAGGMGGPGADSDMDMSAALAQLLGGNPQQAQQAQAEAMQPATDRTYIWRIVHAIASLFMASYVVLSSSILFVGTKEAREQDNLDGSQFGSRLFFWFATTEVVLQSSRYMLERGQLPRSGMLGMAAAVIPEPWAGYIRIAGRYSTILSTVAQDAMVILFVLGMVAWWNGQLGS